MIPNRTFPIAVKVAQPGVVDYVKSRGAYGRLAIQDKFSGLDNAIKEQGDMLTDALIKVVLTH